MALLALGYLRLFGAWVSAEPAEVFADLLEPLALSVLDAAVAALAEVTFDGALVCESAEPAADFAALLEFALLNTFDAADAAFAPVTSVFLVMFYLSVMATNIGTHINVWGIIKYKKCLSN